MYPAQMFGNKHKIAKRNEKKRGTKVNKSIWELKTGVLKCTKSGSEMAIRIAGLSLFQVMSCLRQYITC